MTRDEEERPIRTEEQWPVQTDPASGRTSASRIRPPLRFYMKGLTGCPMEDLTTVILEGFTPNVERTTPEQFAELLFHSQLSVLFYFFFRTCVLAFADLSLSFFSLWSSWLHHGGISKIIGATTKILKTRCPRCDLGSPILQTRLRLEINQSRSGIRRSRQARNSVRRWKLGPSNLR